MTVNLEDRADSQQDMTTNNEEFEEPRLGGTDIFRGGLVIGLATLIGGFVMLRGLAQDPVTESGAAITTSSTEPEAPESNAEASTATGVDQDSPVTPGIAPADGVGTASGTPASEDEGPADITANETGGIDPPAVPDLRPPAEVRVLVLNGAAQRQGVAASGTEVLKAASYTTAAPKNASKTTAQSLIYYLDGYQAEASAVADTFGPELTGIVQPYDPANPPIDDIQDANVIVIIGEDDIIPIP